MANVVLFSDTSRSGMWLRGIGPYVLATYLRQQGYTVEVIDFISGLDWEDFCRVCDRFIGDDTKIIGISTTWIEPPMRYVNDLPNVGIKNINDFYHRETHRIYYDSFSWALTSNTAGRFLDYAKARAPRARLVIGGARAVEFMDIIPSDHVMLGYSENQFLELLKGRRIFGRIINHDPKAESGPFEFSRAQTVYEDSDCMLEGEVLPIEVGRGCIFRCSYCAFPLNGKDKLSHTKPADQISEEMIRNWQRWRVRDYLISDDTFNDSIDKLRIMRDMVKTLPFQPRFWAFARLDLITVQPEQIELLKDIGIRIIVFGIESWNPASARAIGKGMAPERKVETLKRLRAAWGDRIHLKSGFIIGLPYETTETIEQWYSWMLTDDCPLDHVSIWPLMISRPYPNNHLRWLSELDKNFEKYGYHFRDAENDWDWSKEDHTDIRSFREAQALYLKWHTTFDPHNQDMQTAMHLCNTKTLKLDLDQLFDADLGKIKNENDYKLRYLRQVKCVYVPCKLGLGDSQSLLEDLTERLPPAQFFKKSQGN